jgi:formiminotetrahydrofolate cyclodeaminase
MTYRTSTIDDFLARIASEQITPAGGTAAAVVAAIGASLCEMACIHTVEKDEYATVATDVADVRDELQRQRGQLLDLADADANVVDELFSAVDGEPNQSDIKRSIGVPLTIAATCANVLDLAVDVTATGNRNALADVGTGVFVVRAALRASVFTVRSNVDRVSDQSFVDDVEQRLTEIESRADDAHDRTLHHIEERSDGTV